MGNDRDLCGSFKPSCLTSSLYHWILKHFLYIFSSIKTDLWQHLCTMKEHHWMNYSQCRYFWDSFSFIRKNDLYLTTICNSCHNTFQLKKTTNLFASTCIRNRDEHHKSLFIAARTGWHNVLWNKRWRQSLFWQARICSINANVKAPGKIQSWLILWSCKRITIRSQL